jgi:hypothetical protein
VVVQVEARFFPFSIEPSGRGGMAEKSHPGINQRSG